MSQQAASCLPHPQDGQPTVLIVEGQAPIACLLQFVLEQDGFRVVHKESGHEAATFMGSHRPPDIVLLNIALPDTTGLEVLRQIRASEQGKRLPVILLAAGQESVHTIRASAVGATACLRTPLSPMGLPTHLRRYLNVATDRC